MHAGLYDILRGQFADGQPIETVPESAHRLNSVISNLTGLLNSRRHAVEHLPDFGLPDLGSLYREMPESGQDLRKYIKDLVEKYEPRLSKVRVREEPAEASSMRVTIIVTGELDGRRVRLQTTFASNEAVQVDQYTRRE
ncbi:MAG: type VI secretion system baseplate subunit TssE [Rhodothermia bacterium]|nr:type VI secretion system baseplate subunit TssE [Rhodothermia bacterium]